MNVGVISLGCDKNRIDTENMLAYLAEDGFRLTADAAEADVLIVNTCAFIESAKQEAIDTVLEMARYKEQKCKILVVTGCLAQRYMDELRDALPEVDVFLGTANYDKLPQILKNLSEGTRYALDNDRDTRRFSAKRVLTTPYHYAYLKIAEGCDNHCTYCAIPAIRGKFTSRPIEEIAAEAEQLIGDYGVKELILVAQDVSRYGEDLYGRPMLRKLLERLCATQAQWIRLLYLYPERMSDELLDFIAREEKICNYLDIPCQHIDDTILKKMNRGIRGAQIEALLGRIRSRGDFAVRSTFIVGFPGETEAQFASLKDFIRRAELDRCGFFAYSAEEGTAAARMPGQIDERTKQRRLRELYRVQSAVMARKLAARVGETLEVIYEGIDESGEYFVGRSRFDAPEVDTRVRFRSAEPVEIGTVYPIKITAFDGADLMGERV